LEVNVTDKTWNEAAHLIRSVRTEINPTLFDLGKNTANIHFHSKWQIKDYFIHNNS